MRGAAAIEHGACHSIEEPELETRTSKNPENPRNLEYPTNLLNRNPLNPLNFLNPSNPFQ
jgi:hypothetical protein